ncbi:MAG: N-acetyltransferase [Cyanobacteria bacterium SZAS LIN-2]|nr:N-acetyltransferase [Cyanobacteria bacterium SZAS LIN-3]MBS1996388.1 N-acetyltransferase [Cyanobacteria bacterium SZAS LIN-2]
MSTPHHIRVATEGDAAAILAIYAPFCGPDSAVSFEIEPPSLDEMRSRIASTLPALPWIVAHSADGKLLGYAYAAMHKTRAAYRWSVDVTIYLGPDARRQGVGRRLYTRLFDILRGQGYVNAYAGITLPNEASQGLHRAMGFYEVGVYEQVGFKSGKWHDVIWLALRLQHHSETPAEPITFSEYISKNGV